MRAWGEGGRGPHYSDLFCQHLRPPMVSEKTAVKYSRPAVCGNGPGRAESRPRDRDLAPDGVWGTVGAVV
jgi:hypothetical protein